MAVTTLAVAGLASSAYGAYSSAKGAKEQTAAARDAMAAAGRSTSLGALSGSGGGYGFSASPSNGSINLDYGQQGNALNSLFGGLSGQAGISAANAGAGLPGGVNQALLDTTFNGGKFFDPTIYQGNALSGQLGTAFDQAQQGYQQLYGAAQPGQNALTGTAFTGAAQQAAAASQGFDGLRQQTLDTLRTQAQPFEQRQLQGMQNNQFATGRLGTTGGSLQTEAFARGLGQADLDRQLQATNVANNQQQLALQSATGLSNIGNQQLQNAFGNFNSMASQYSNQLQNRFGNAALTNSQNYGQLNQNFANQSAAAALPAALQGAYLQNASGALGLQGQQQQMGLNLANFGLNMGQVQGNLQLGNQSNVVNAANNPNIGSYSDTLGSIFSGIGQRVGGNADLASLFGGGNNMNQLQYQQVTAQRM